MTAQELATTRHVQSCIEALTEKARGMRKQADQIDQLVHVVEQLQLECRSLTDRLAAVFEAKQQAQAGLGDNG